MDDRLNECRDEAETAARYRIRAERLRAIASDNDVDTGALLAGIAVEYERMATVLEGLGRSHSGQSKPARVCQS